MRGKPIVCRLGFCTPRITPAGAGKTYKKGDIVIDYEDHPRRCGENAEKMVMKTVHDGSPPQVRGKRISSFVIPSPRRITPAGAGKTQKDVVLEARYKDHPRRCGENIDPSKRHCKILGSPPQVRGKRDGAYPSSYTPVDHPRRCGENLLYADWDFAPHGSPPQVRGKRTKKVTL